MDPDYYQSVRRLNQNEVFQDNPGYEEEILAMTKLAVRECLLTENTKCWFLSKTAEKRTDRKDC